MAKENNGENKIRSLLTCEKGKDGEYIWGEWLDKSYDDYPCFRDIPPEEIPKYIEELKDTNVEPLINSIENHQKNFRGHRQFNHNTY